MNVLHIFERSTKSREERSGTYSVKGKSSIKVRAEKLGISGEARERDVSADAWPQCRHTAQEGGGKHAHVVMASVHSAGGEMRAHTHMRRVRSEGGIQPGCRDERAAQQSLA